MNVGVRQDRFAVQGNVDATTIVFRGVLMNFRVCQNRLAAWADVYATTLTRNRHVRQRNMDIYHGTLSDSIRESLRFVRYIVYISFCRARCRE